MAQIENKLDVNYLSSISNKVIFKVHTSVRPSEEELDDYIKILDNVDRNQLLLVDSYVEFDEKIKNLIFYTINSRILDQNNNLICKVNKHRPENEL